MPKLKYNNIFILLCLSVLPQVIMAQYTPYFKNYVLSEYNAGNQNWGVSRAENGKLYVANNNGLLEYDGLKWDFKELPNKTTIRSVLAYKDRIYTGSYEEFGYWTKDSKGELVYFSLSNTMKKKLQSNEDIWQILQYKDTIIFRSFLNIYIYYPNGSIKIKKPKSTIISCDVIGNKLYISTLKNGIYTLDEGELNQLVNDKALEHVKIVSIVDYNDTLLITTSLEGCFIYSNNTLKPINFEVNNLIKQHQLNGFSVLKNGNMIFGTIKNGAYFTNNKGDIIYHINKENGLNNNTILSQYVDNEGLLWLGLDNGLSSVDLKSHIYFFNDVSGKLGAVYDVINFNGTIYLGSNTGLFYLEHNNLKFVEGSQGQVWDLKKINGELFCGHNDGTFIVKNKQLVPISSFTGGWTIEKVPEKSNIYIQGTYTGLIRFKKNNGEWNDVKRLGKKTDPIKFLVFEDQFTVWAAHAYKGLYRIKFNKDYDSILSDINYHQKGIFSDFNVRVYKIKNNICFETNEGWLRYEPLLDSIVPYDLLNESFGKDSYIISEADIDPLVLKKSKDVIEFKYLTNGVKGISLTSNYFEDRLIVGYENISKIDDSTYALNLDNGFMLIDDKSSFSSNPIKPEIDKIEIDKALIDLDLSNEIAFKFSKSISIFVSSPKSNNHFFEYAIKELDSTKWYKLDKEKFELPNLYDGSYTVLIKTSTNFGASSPATTLKIKVLPPWYRDTLGYTLYFLIIIIIVAIIYFLHKRKVEKEQRLLKIKLNKEQQEILREKALENEKKIVQLKNESLKNEVKLKSKQLANTAMALVKKNETLQEIKKELLQTKESFDNYYSYKKILKKVDNSIAHKDEWKIFEYNFNQVHEEFFKDLKAKHSQLTHKDLKICAYIKMNLSNKEIAPLLNISLRGVETHRYRLKKKLNLENSISLTSYLSNLEK